MVNYNQSFLATMFSIKNETNNDDNIRNKEDDDNNNQNKKRGNSSLLNRSLGNAPIFKQVNDQQLQRSKRITADYFDDFNNLQYKNRKFEKEKGEKKRSEEEQELPYILTSKVLGEGANSKVILAYDKRTFERLAVKIIDLNRHHHRRHRDEEEESINSSKLKIEKEIQILAKLNSLKSSYNAFLHLHYVVTIKECIIDDDDDDNDNNNNDNDNDNNDKTCKYNERLHIAMDYVEGCELFEICNDNDLMVNERFVKSLIYKLLLAVNDLHQNEICHLDLKLENIMYNKRDNSLKIIDFGFAQLTTLQHDDDDDDDSDDDDNYIDEKQVLQTTYCGSIHYAAPELLNRTPFDGKKADVWSLGIIIFALIAGHFPFDDIHARPSIIFSKIRHSLISYPPYFNHLQMHLLNLMLEKNPNRRPSISSLLSHPYFTS